MPSITLDWRSLSIASLAKTTSSPFTDCLLATSKEIICTDKIILARVANRKTNKDFPPIFIPSYEVDRFRRIADPPNGYWDKAKVRITYKNGYAKLTGIAGNQETASITTQTVTPPQVPDYASLFRNLETLGSPQASIRISFDNLEKLVRLLHSLLLADTDLLANNEDPPPSVVIRYWNDQAPLHIEGNTPDNRRIDILIAPHLPLPGDKEYSPPDMDTPAPQD